MIDKIIEELEEANRFNRERTECDFVEGYSSGLDRAIEIVKMNQNYGWILCSERMPEDGLRCYVTLRYQDTDYLHVKELRFDKYGHNDWYWNNGAKLSKEWNVIAWQPAKYPKPYIHKKAGEI